MKFFNEKISQQSLLSFCSIVMLVVIICGLTSCATTANGASEIDEQAQILSSSSMASSCLVSPPTAVTQPVNVNAIVQSPVAINYCEIRYADDKYAWPYIQHNITNNLKKTIVEYQIVLLAYDSDGNPMELYWDARNVDKSGGHGNVGFGNGVDYGIVVGIYPYSPKSYDWLIDKKSNISSSETQIEVEGGWPLFDGWWDQPNGVHQVSYILSCIKQVKFEDGTTWKNSEYDTWLEEYKGKSVALETLGSYYEAAGK